MSEWRTDPARHLPDDDLHAPRPIAPTGIYVRALRGDRWDSVDIVELDRDSLDAFVRSRGEVSRFAVSLVQMLLGHHRG